MCLFTALALKHSDVCYEVYLSITYVKNQQHYLTVDCVQQIDALMSTVNFALSRFGSACASLAYLPKTNISKISQTEGVSLNDLDQEKR